MEVSPLIKIYEGLGAIGDSRVQLEKYTARVRSSSGNKFYEVTYDPISNSITSNDNGSYWLGYLGYPAIAYLLKGRVVEYDNMFTEYLKDIKWKDINQRY